MDGSNNKPASPPFSKLTERLAGPRSRAWETADRAVQMETAGRDIIHLSVGDPDFDTPQGIIDVALRSMQESRTHYSPIPGERHLVAAIADSGANQLGVPVAPEQVIIFPGAQCALFATMLCLSGPGDEVILLEPFYSTYEGVACAGGADLVTVPMPSGSDFALDTARIADAVTDKTRVILANSPGNPSGTVFDRKSWQQLADLCQHHNIWLISDEVYSNLVFDGEHVSPFGLPGMRDRVVLVNSLSKTYAMTGWRLGWTISSPALATHLGRLSQSLVFGVSQFTQDAAARALQDPPPEVHAMKTAFRARRDVLCAALGKIDGLTIHKPAGGMFIMVDVSGTGYDGRRFADELLDQEGIAVVPGFGFGDSVANCIRVGYLHDETVLKKAADRIARFVEGLEA